MNRDRIQGISHALIFTGLMLVCSVVASMVGAFAGPAIFGETISMIPGGAIPSDDGSWWQLHFQNFIAQALGFGGAVFIASAMWNRSVPVGWSKRAPVSVLILAWLATIVAAPLMAASYEWNVALIPEGSALEAAFKPMEDMLEQVTAFLVTADGARRMVVILSVAAVPAIFEELAFRGGLQPLLIKATGRPWMGILLASIIFSAIHFQFYGFFPRLILGALFGWMAWRTGSLWPGIAAHFINNAAAALTLWTTGSMTEDLFELESWMVLVSIALTLGTLFAIHRLTPSMVSGHRSAG